MNAVFKTGGKQYRVSSGDKLTVERLNVEAGQTATFDHVLVVNNEGQLSVGSPTVPNATVIADVLEHRRGPKKTAFRMLRRKGFHKKIGHRQDISVIRIREINV